MKIIAFRRSVGAPVTIPPEIDIMPDSAMTVANRPLFLPDFAPEWKGVVAPAFRISRLGKEIGRKYASRYYDAVTLALRISPVGIPCSDSAVMKAFDGGITLGPWQPLPSSENKSLEDASYDIKWQDLSTILTNGELCIDEAIEAVSHYCTFKTGDVVIPLELRPALALRPDATFTASINGAEFTVKIK